MAVVKLAEGVHPGTCRTRIIAAPGDSGLCGGLHQAGDPWVDVGTPHHGLALPIDVGIMEGRHGGNRQEEDNRARRNW
jgi:hypothetical protein